ELVCQALSRIVRETSSGSAISAAKRLSSFATRQAASESILVGKLTKLYFSAATRRVVRAQRVRVSGCIPSAEPSVCLFFICACSRGSQVCFVKLLLARVARSRFSHFMVSLVKT